MIFLLFLIASNATYNAKGEEVPKSQIKKLQKLYAKQEETYKKFQSES